MRIPRRTTVRAFAVAAMIGAVGITGAAVASADTLTELNPKDHAGAYCMVIDDEGESQLLYSRVDCLVAQAQIDADHRREDRRDERRAERRADLEKKQQDARDERAAERSSSAASIG